MRSGDALDFHAAAFELFVYQVLRRADTSPTVISRGNDKTADFAIHCNSGPDGVVEARLTNDGDPLDWQHRLIIRRVLNEIVHPDVGFNVVRSGRIAHQPSAKRIRHQVRTFLESTKLSDYVDGVRADRHSTAPTCQLDIDGATVVLSPVVRRVGATSQPVPIYYWSDHLPQINTIEAIRRAIKKKAGRYESLSGPYVICLNVLGEIGVLDSEIEEALFGAGIAGTRQIAGRRDGLWRPNQHRRVSGVLAVVGLVPSPATASADQRPELRLFVNPWATHAVPAELRQLQRVEVENGELVAARGLNSAALFRY
jgi:hypothetical protein